MSKELYEACVKVRDDLLMRAEVDSNGTKVVSCGQSVWCVLNNAIENEELRREELSKTVNVYAHSMKQMREVEAIINKGKKQ